MALVALVSYFATLIGGVASNLAAGPFALFGYLVCGLGDAAGEPVGTRWGRHWYPVPARRGVNARRSLEGSAGVLVVALGAIAIATAALTGPESLRTAWPVLLLMAALSTAAEALTPHGWDNVTLQLAPSLLAVFLLHP